MTIYEPVHWHEGLFLQPHHLQTMQLQLSERLNGERRLNWPYPYGLIESKVSADGLENMLVKFDRLHVVMPSGLEVRVPENTDLPSLDIKTTFESSTQPFMVYLGVPLWQGARANTLAQDRDADWRIKRMWKVSEIDRPDENTGENGQPVQVRRVNARLLLAHEDQTDMELLPLMRIAHATGEDVGLPRQDPAYVAPCMVLSGSPFLRELVRDLANQVEASRSELVVQLTRGGGFSLSTLRGVQYEQVWRLRTLNRFSGTLPHLVRAPGTSPFSVYLMLRELLGELAALHPDRDPFEAPAYDHDNPRVSFDVLSDKIRALLRGSVAASFMKIDFEAGEEMHLATLEDQHIQSANEYFLGIRTKIDPRELANLVVDIDKFKFMAESKATQRVWGIRLEEERHPPTELPSEVGLHYFRLNRADSARMWSLIETEKRIAVRWPGQDRSDFKLTLFMTAPGGEE